jgi:hypothetical protein
VRFWDVDSGDMLKVFTDSTPILIAFCMRHHHQAFVSASCRVLRLVDSQNGAVLQKFRLESEIRSLQLDSSGLLLFAGTRSVRCILTEPQFVIFIRRRVPNVFHMCTKCVPSVPNVCQMCSKCSKCV